MIAENVKILCHCKGVTMAEIAARMGVTRQSMSRTLKANITISTAERIAAIFGVPAWVLFAPSDKLLNEINQGTPKNAVFCPYCGKPIVFHAEPISTRTEGK